MKTKIKEIEVFVCEMCGEEYISMKDVPERCRKSIITDFTDDAKVGDVVIQNLLGEECGFELMGCVLEIQEHGHERGMLVKDYLSNSTIYLGESDHECWYILDDNELDAWKKMMNIKLDAWTRMINENPKPKVD